MTYSTFIHSGIVNPSKPAIAIKETQDSIDSITLDIPLLTRLLELAREEINDDAQLHQIITNILELKNSGVLGMQHYDKIINKKQETELESILKLAGFKK